MWRLSFSHDSCMRRLLLTCISSLTSPLLNGFGGFALLAASSALCLLSASSAPATSGGFLRLLKGQNGGMLLFYASRIKTIMSEFIDRLDAVVESQCEPMTGVIFSGGVDSSLLAVLAAAHCSVTAYTVGVEGAPDLPFARSLKDSFHLEIINLTEGDIEAELPKIVPIIKNVEGHVSPVRVGAELPSHFASRLAAANGLKVMLSGQGPDEMFGGYARYIPLLLEQGYDALERLLKKDTMELKNGIIKIDRAVCARNGIQLRNPFLDGNFVEYGLSLDVKDRLWMGDKKPSHPHEEHEGSFIIRKFVEKRAAEELLPKEIVWRPKKAAQYGSGIHKALDRIARRKGFKEKARKQGSKQYLTMFLESYLEDG